MPQKEPVIKTKSLTKKYGRTKAVDNLNLEVKEGEIFGFLGPNGAGKTTTIKMFLNLVRPTAGEIKVLGRLPENFTGVKKEISYLGENYQLYPHLNPLELLKLVSAMYGGIDIDKAVKELKNFGIPLAQKIKDLSKGMRQLVGLVQALLNRGKIIILDEPTSGLDPLMRSEVLSLIQELKDEGRTIFFSSHNLYEVEKLADRVGLIKQGRLLKVCNIEEVQRGEKKIIFVPQGDLEESELTLPGITGIEKKGHKYFIYYSDNERGILQHLSSIPYFSLQIEKPDLEDLFIQLVGGGNDANTARDPFQ